MKFLNWSSFYRKKYYIRIVLSISLVAVFLVGALTLALYIYGKQTLSRIESQNNSKILNQVKFNFELMDSTVQNIAKYLFVNPDTTAILNSTGIVDPNDIYTRINRVTSSVISSNLFIHSIGFYNDYQSQYYYAGKQLYYDDTGMKQMITDYQKFPRMKPIFRSIDNTFGDKIVKETIITYLLYQASGDPAKIDFAVAVNVKSDWIKSNINQLNMVNDNTGESTYVYSDTSGFLENSNPDANLQQALLTEYRREIQNNENDLGSFEQKLNKQNYVITYLHLKNQGLTIFKIQSTAVVYQSLYTFSIFLLVIFFASMLVALLFSIMASSIVYNPIQRLVRQVTGIADTSHGGDEISFLSSSYNESMSTIKKYDLEKQNYNSIMKTYFIKTILTGELRASEESFEATCREHQLHFHYNGSYCLCLIQIDEFVRFQQRYGMKDRNLFKYAILNIVTETFAEVSPVEGVNMHDHDIVLIVPCEKLDASGLETLESTVRKAQNFIQQYCKMSVTFTISGIIDNVKNISEAYLALLNDASYRFVFGHGSLVTANRIKTNKDNRNNSHSQKLEVALLDNVSAGNMPGIKQSLTMIQHELTGLSYENMTISLVHILNALSSKLISDDKRTYKETGHGILEILKSLGNFETIEECFEKLFTVLNPIFDGGKSDEPTNHNIVLETVCKIIDLTFAETTLCADLIATKLKIHPRRLAKIFKEVTGMSVADYINEVRMQKAASLLENSTMSVYDIIFQVGYENESYFYKMFKTRYGITPKEFRIKLGLK